MFQSTKITTIIMPAQQKKKGETRMQPTLRTTLMPAQNRIILVGRLNSVNELSNQQFLLPTISSAQK